MTQQHSEGHQEVIASPNPTIDDSKSSVVGPSKVEATRVQATQSATEAPMKTTARPKSKSRTRRTRPRD